MSDSIDLVIAAGKMKVTLEYTMFAVGCCAFFLPNDENGFCVCTTTVDACGGSFLLLRGHVD